MTFIFYDIYLSRETKTRVEVMFDDFIHDDDDYDYSITIPSNPLKLMLIDI